MQQFGSVLGVRNGPFVSFVQLSFDVRYADLATTSCSVDAKIFSHISFRFQARTKGFGHQGNHKSVVNADLRDENSR